MASRKTKILTKRKFWFANFTKICLKWSAKRQSLAANCDSNSDLIANLNPARFMTLLLRVNLLLEFLLTPFRFDRTDKGEGILVYIREDVTPHIYDHTECLTIKINLHKTNWLLICLYNPLKSKMVYHLNSLGKILDHNLA